LWVPRKNICRTSRIGYNREQRQIQRRERQVSDLDGLQATAPVGAQVAPRASQGALAAARQARIEADLAGCEMEELTAALHRKPPVGRWPRLVQPVFGPTVAVLAG
jgi:hypothetical protein